MCGPAEYNDKTVAVVSTHIHPSFWGILQPPGKKNP